MKNSYLRISLVLVLLTLAIGCGTPREKSINTMKSAMLTYSEAQKIQQENPGNEKEIDRLQAQTLKLLEESVKLDSTNLDAINNQARVLQAFKYFDDAAIAFERGYRQIPKPPYTGENRDSLQNLWNNFNNGLYICYRNVKQWDKAIYHAENIRDFFPSLYAEATQTYAYVLAQKTINNVPNKLYDINKAVEQFEKAVDAYIEAAARTGNPQAVQGISGSARYFELYSEELEKEKGIKTDYPKIVATYEKALRANKDDLESARALVNVVNDRELPKNEAYKKALAAIKAAPAPQKK